MTITDFSGEEMTVYGLLVLLSHTAYNHFIIGYFWCYRLYEVLRQSYITVD